MIESQSHPKTDSPPMIPAVSEGRPAPSGNLPKILAASLAIGRGATSSSAPRWLLKIKNSVQPRAVRHYDEFASAKRDSGTDGVVVPGLSAALVVDRPRPLRSCRHILENRIL